MSELQELQHEIQHTTTIQQVGEILDSVDARASQALIMSGNVLRIVQDEEVYPLQQAYVDEDEAAINELEQDWLLRGEK